MVVKRRKAGKVRGHPIYRDGDVYRYIDSDGLVDRLWKGRPCGYCGQETTPEGHDPCLGTLPGVMNACCGHGEGHKAYVQMNDGTRLGGSEVLNFFTENGRGPPNED